MPSLAWFAAALLLAAPAAPAKKAAAKPSSVDKAVSLYQKGAFKQAATALKAALADGKLPPADATRAQAFLGASQLGQGDAAAAKASVAALLDASPDFVAEPPLAAPFAQLVTDERKARADAKSAADKAAAEKAAAEKAAAEKAAAESAAAQAKDAGSGTAKKKPKKVAVLDVKATGLEPKRVQGLSPIVAAAAERLGAQVISNADIATMLGFERQKSLLGCDDGQCLAEIGGALGVDYLLSTEVASVSGTLVLSQVLLDSHKATAVKRTSLQVLDPAGLPSAATDSTNEVLAVALGVVPSQAVRAESQPLLRSRVPGIVTLVGGVAIAGGGAAAALLALQSRGEAQKFNGVDKAAFDRALAETRTRALVSDVLVGVGAAAAATGLVLIIVAKPPQHEAITLAPTPAGVLVSGRF
ncbi:MAG: hypothetical protein QM765_34790 [Myxococcales bacterium]